MSFSKDIKNEIADKLSNARHCRIAELAAVLSLAGSIICENGSLKISLVCENKVVAEKCALLIKKLFSFDLEIVQKRTGDTGKKKMYTITVSDEGQVQMILDTVKAEWEESEGSCHIKTQSIVFQQQCCRRAYIRGAFLAAGSLSDPEKTYHFEIVANDMEQAKQLEEVLNSFELDAKIIIRKEKYVVVYIKDGSKIVDVLSVMEAYVSMMNLENVRILKEMRNTVNRQVNCEAANLNKTVIAANKQIDDIRLVEKVIGLDKLPEGVGEVARLRLEYPDSSLKELSDMMVPPVGKSGVNHRLKKISQIAQSIREDKGGEL